MLIFINITGFLRISKDGVIMITEILAPLHFTGGFVRISGGSVDRKGEYYDG